MKTKSSLDRSVEEAASVLKRGGVVAFPTETVYGLGALARDVPAVRKIFRIKGRPADNPLIVHIAEKGQLLELVREVPDNARRLIGKFWPGPLTIVLKRSGKVPKIVTAGLDTVAVRMPAHPVARSLIRAAGGPIAAPSANISGRPSATRASHVLEELRGKADFILAGGYSKVGLESTVVDCTCEPPRILRPGAVTLEQLRRVVPGTDLASGKEKRPASPGMKHRHYEPRCKVIVVEKRDWAGEVRKQSRNGVRIGVLVAEGKMPEGKNIVFKKKLHAKNLYADFYEAERAKVDVLLVESVSKKGIGLALMDRISRASGEKG